ncbi:MAG: DUF192 domain-containing protein [Candidatus Schekmanbacteria bacterium]|nr:DUF192 domain-containing protein [Candidatus Schekmanbacteria bacterium]
MPLRCHNTETERVIANQVFVADTFIKRLCGLLNQKRLHSNQGMLLTPCRAVHTCFLFYPIDLVFLDNENRVVEMVKALKPFRMAGCKQAVSVLELPAGSVAISGIKPGERLSFEEVKIGENIGRN